MRIRLRFLSTALLGWALVVGGGAIADESTGETEKKENETKAKIKDYDQLRIDQLVAPYVAEQFPLDYGTHKTILDIHAYLNAALWSFGDQSWGSHADKGSSLAGKPTFITYSGYVDIRGSISDTLMAEAEFELYKGQKGQFKVCKLRGVWKPSEYFQLSLGRDFPPIGIQDKVYYPTSQFRLFANSPYLYWSVLRATGWWDVGVHLGGTIPLKFISEDFKITWKASVINGPGEQHQSEDDYLVSRMKPNSDGYMYESFHNKARQPWDNNKGKFFPVRISISPFKGLEIGGSFMFGTYDDSDLRSARYYFGHLLYGGERLTIAAEFGQLEIDVDPLNMQTDHNRQNGTWADTLVIQRSMYASAGYRILYKQWGLHYLEPVIRYEWMDSWVQDSTNRGDRHALWAGLRFSPLPGWIIKAAYLFQWEPGGPDLDNGGLVLETVFVF